MNDVQVDNNVVMKIVKGLGISLISTLITIFLFSLILSYTNISKNIIPIVVIGLTFVSILLGSIISMKKETKNGLIKGAIIGGIYVVLLYLISSFLNTGFALNGYTIGMIVAGIVSGIIGGIIGVNT